MNGLRSDTAPCRHTKGMNSHGTARRMVLVSDTAWAMSASEDGRVSESQEPARRFSRVGESEATAMSDRVRGEIRGDANMAGNVENDS